MEADLNALIGRNVKAARLAHPERPNHRQLAEMLKEVDPARAPNHQRVSDWERGIQKPDDRYMQSLSKVLDRPIAWFYTDHTPPKEETPNPFPDAQLDDSDRLQALEDLVSSLDEQVRLLKAETATRDAEVLQQIEAGFRTIQELLRQRPQ